MTSQASEGRGRGRFWWRWLVVTALLYGLVVGLFVVNGSTVRPAPLLLLVALATAAMALVNVALNAEGPDWEVESAAPVSEPGQDTRLAMYTRVIRGHLDSRHPDPALRDRLAALADGRLRQRRGVGLHDPTAVELLGPDAVDVLTGPVRRVSRTEIANCVKRIEEL